MKTKVFFLVMVAFVSTLVSFVKAEDIFNNTEYDEAGRPTIVEEYTKYKSGDLAPLKKTTFTYSTNGNCVEKVIYNWDAQKSTWAEKKKVECKYNSNGKMISMVNLEWNNRNKTWDVTSQLEYKYDEQGNLIS